MALQLTTLHFPATTSVPPPVKPPRPNCHLHLHLHLRPSLTTRSRSRSRSTAARAIEESQEKPRSEIGEPEEAKPADELAELGAEIKELKKKMAEKGGEVDFWGGVAEEIKEIEWPPFGKVLGTTGAVLAVIAGSSVVLLTVNAVLAELSDKVFAGKGVQDFFG